MGIGRMREIYVDDVLSESKKFYDTAAYGGIETKLPEDNDARTKLRDAAIMVYSEITSIDVSPAVEINVRRSNDNYGLKFHKIHLERKENGYENN